jgi:hypothetical protein
MGIFAVACVIAAAAAIAAIIAYPDGELGQFLPMSMALASSFVIVYILRRASRSMEKSSADVEEFMRTLRVAQYHMAAGTPVALSMRKASLSTMEGRIRKVMDAAALRVGAGDEAMAALYGAVAADRQLSKDVSAYMDRGSGLGEVVSMHEGRRKENASRMQSLFARYATAGMFLSTVAPSFIIFSFVGSMLISRSAVGTQAMAMGLLCAVPVAYSVIHYMSSRGFFGQG